MYLKDIILAILFYFILFVFAFFLFILIILTKINFLILR